MNTGKTRLWFLWFLTGILMGLAIAYAVGTVK